MRIFFVLYFFTFFCFYFGYTQDNNCILDSGIEVNPAPNSDPNFTGFSTFPAETTVEFCYTVEQYNTPGTQNWMHGIVPLFGPGWDLTTLEPVGQPETQFEDDGEWIWVGDVVAGVTGELISSPGWWFDAPSGGGELNGDPSDNWGDGNNGPWEFCWQITTQSCPPAFNGTNLIVEIANYADSETGSWDNSEALEQCIDDPSYYVQGLQLDCPTCDESGLTVINPTCANIDETGGVVIITPEGVGPWNYVWLNLNTGQIIEQNDNVTLPVTVSGLVPAEYLIQVEDLGFVGGCSVPIYFEILTQEEIIIDFDIIDALCFDSNDGIIEINSIMNSNCIDDNLIADDCCGLIDTNGDDLGDGIINNDDFSCPSTENLVCGCDFVTYFNACQAENWYGITNYEVGACSESNDTYSISWNSVNSINGLGDSIYNLFSGEYQLSVQCLDNTSPVFGCDFDTTLIVGSPEEFDYNFFVTDVSCFIDFNNDGINDITDGLITIELTGGTAEYSTFASSLNGEEDLGFQVGSSIVFNNLGFGQYYFTPIDANGCMVASQEVFFNITEPEPLVVDNFTFSNYNSFAVSCGGAEDGFINLNISGGTPPYNYLWSNDFEGQNLINASAGNYSVIITDNNGCELELNELILTEPVSVDIFAIDIQSVSCSGSSDGNIAIGIDGGVPPYSFAWSGPGFFNSNNQDIENISTGEYTITVTDGNNCSYQQVFNVTTPNPIVINEVINNISCFQEDDGSIDLTIFGGTSPYTYSWSTLDNLQDINNLSPGVYEITVTDDEGCFESALYDIEEPELLTATVSTIDVDCFGDNTGLAISDINGGTPPYIQSWSAGANPNNLFAGTYSLLVTDFNGCTYTINDIVINQPDSELELTASIIDVLPCNGYQTGSILPIASGGTPPYEYFSPGLLEFDNLFSGNYVVYVEDFNGCITQTNFFIDEPDEVSALINTIDISCFGLTDGQADVVPSGGTPPYIFTWLDLLGNTVDNNNLAAGTYFVVVEDNLGCLFNDSFSIIEPSTSNMSIEVLGQTECLETFTLNVSGASGGYWSGTGPGDVVFPNINSFQTDVTVSEYGFYEFIFTNDCGEQVMSNVQMLSLAPTVEAIPSTIYCDFEATLQAYSNSGEGFWTVLDPLPENTIVNIDDIYSFTPEISMSPINPNEECCYGDYLFSFTSCGKEDVVSLTIAKEAPEFGISTHQDCLLEAQIFIENPISFTQALIDPGYWDWYPIGNNGNVDIYYQTPHEISFSVSEYGLYEFQYMICDTFYQHFVGFSCPLQIPNVFSPNGDSNNDLFLGGQLIPLIHSQINFTVYNRFGQIVHAQSNYDFQNNLWDGTTNTFENKELNDGVYYYTLELFNNASRKKELYNGYVHLFRGVD